LLKGRGKEITMNASTKISALLFALSTLAFGCASAGGVSGHLQTAAAERGAVLVDGPSVKVVVAGPISFHAYSEFSGGALYAAAAVTGTDLDCKAAAARHDAAELRRDSVATFTVAAGQVACLATTTSRSFELLWHALKDAPPAAAPNASSVMFARN
jgi:hypothetical protein